MTTGSLDPRTVTRGLSLSRYGRHRRGYPLNRSIGVGLEGILLTSHIYSCTQSMVPYLGDDEFGTAWSDPRLGALSPEARPGGRPVRAAPPSLGAVDQPGHPALAIASRGRGGHESRLVSTLI